MIDFNSAYKKLNDPKSNVSCHYLISRQGKIYNLLCPKFKGWHAGVSEWKNIKNLNDYSIGIELENKGHEHGYTSFTNYQYYELKKLIKSMGEKCKIAIRNIRRDGNDDLKKLLKSKEISDDDEKSFQKKIQDITDKHIVVVENKVSSKEKEIMTI